ncbi:MAG: hypothetical protein ACERIH_04790 [Labilibaculum antarcticum]
MRTKIEQQKKEEYYYLRTSEAIGSYYKQFERIPVTSETYMLWLESFEISGRDVPRDISFRQASKDLNFMRFALELNDYGLFDFLKKNLPKYIYTKWYKTEYLEGMDVI